MDSINIAIPKLQNPYENVSLICEKNYTNLYDII
jgi:hypothetical protein